MGRNRRTHSQKGIQYNWAWFFVQVNSTLPYGDFRMAKVTFRQEGRSGKVQYVEGLFFRKHTCEFYWEFGGPDMIATIWFPADEWSAGRRGKRNTPSLWNNV